MAKPTGEDPSERRDNDGLHKRRGIWYYCLTVNGERRFFSTRTTNYQEARKARSAAEKAQEAGLLPNDFAKWPFSKLLAYVRETRKPPLIAENTVRLEKERSVPLLRHFGDIRVSRIDGIAIRDYQHARSQTVGSRTVNLEVKLLRQVLQTAKTWAAIAPDYKPLPEDRRGPGKALEEAEERLLLDTARSRPGWDVAFYAAMIASNTTARGVDIKKLRIADVNLIEGEVFIKRSKGRTSGIRRIPLNAGAAWAFARLLERAHALGSTEPDHFLLPALNYQSRQPGRGIGYDATHHQKRWRTAWRKLMKETRWRAGREAAQGTLSAGKGLRAAIAAWKRAAAPFRGFRFHDLRHTSITKLAEGQASDATIKAIAGHLSQAMMEHYSHIRNDAKRRAVEAMSSYIPSEEKLSTRRVQ